MVQESVPFSSSFDNSCMKDKHEVLIEFIDIDAEDSKMTRPSGIKRLMKWNTTKAPAFRWSDINNELKQKSSMSIMKALQQ